jgi:hypothetical protein
MHREQNIFLHQLKRAVASKNATCLNVSHDISAFNGSRVYLFIYLLDRLGKHFENKWTKQKKLTQYYSRRF